MYPCNRSIGNNCNCARLTRADALINSPHMTTPRESVTIIGHTYECLHNGFALCHCNPLEFVNSYRYLGLTVDRNFNWKLHIDVLCSKLRAILCKFNNLKHIINKATLHTLYHALADSVISYGLVAYGRTFKTYLNRIYNLQLRLIKNIVDKKTRQNCKGKYHILFKKCNVLPVHVKIKYLLAIYQYKCPTYKIGKTYNRNFRKTSSRKMFVEPRSLNNYYGQRTRGYLIPRIYNRIISENECETKNIFKSKVKACLMDTFIKESESS